MNDSKIKKFVKCDNPLECNTKMIDLLVCLGGDGTLMHASSLFQVKLD